MQLSRYEHRSARYFNDELQKIIPHDWVTSVETTTSDSRPLYFLNWLLKLFPQPLDVPLSSWVVMEIFRKQMWIYVPLKSAKRNEHTQADHLTLTLAESARSKTSEHFHANLRRTDFCPGTSREPTKRSKAHTAHLITLTACTTAKCEGGTKLSKFVAQRELPVFRRSLYREPTKRSVRTELTSSPPTWSFSGSRFDDFLEIQIN